MLFWHGDCIFVIECGFCGIRQFRWNRLFLRRHAEKVLRCDMETGFQSESKTLTELHAVVHVHPAYARCRCHPFGSKTFHVKADQDHRRRNGRWFSLFPPCRAQRDMCIMGPKDVAGNLLPAFTGKEAPPEKRNPYMNTDEKLPKEAVPASKTGTAGKQVLLR